jgi:hypothetical protein
MLATAIDAEVAEWIDSHAHLTDDAGHRPSRTLLGNEQTAGSLGMPVKEHEAASYPHFAI